ncbi:MAG: hypothetical protein CMJ06_04400 [Pelagibacterales bacterium]|nr:hypothetical protein [Pelagibacterales bacterium]OUU61951.1 MAG: hypothetical protein CBC22_05850 [Alphaproteobacteria bacterium TMED62]
MKIFKKLFKIIFFIYPHFLFSETLIKSDLNFLNVNDKKDFIEKCIEKENIKETPRCLNFLGLKIFLHNLDNSEISKQSLKYIENQSIFYLKEAAKRGFIEAYINLGWIYSNDNFKSQDLTKSAEYFDLYYSLKKEGSQLSKLKKENKDQIKIDRNQIILGILIMYKLDLYKKYNIDQNNYYLTEIEYKKGKKIFKEIIDISNLSELEIENLKKDILKTSETNLYELESNLSIFQKKFRRVAIKELNALKEILQELN